MTISAGRYTYHLQDIAKIEAMPLPLNPIHQSQLDQMSAEVAEYEAAQKELIDKEQTESVSLLETACFPKGCLLSQDIQTAMALYAVQQLKQVVLTPIEWTRGAQLLEEPYLSQVKKILCAGCGLIKCPHHTANIFGANGNPLHGIFDLPYSERFDFDDGIVNILLPDTQRKELSEKGVSTSTWMTSSRNQVHIHVSVGNHSIHYYASKKKRKTTLSINNKLRNEPASFNDIVAAITEIVDNIYN